jgi:hypothetical protein
MFKLLSTRVMLCSYCCIAMSVFLLSTDQALVSDNRKDPKLQERLFVLTTTPTLGITNCCHATRTFVTKKQWNAVTFSLTLSISTLMQGISR